MAERVDLRKHPGRIYLVDWPSRLIISVTNNRTDLLGSSTQSHSERGQKALTESMNNYLAHELKHPFVLQKKKPCSFYVRVWVIRSGIKWNETKRPVKLKSTMTWTSDPGVRFTQVEFVASEGGIRSRE